MAVSEDNFEVRPQHRAASAPPTHVAPRAGAGRGARLPRLKSVVSVLVGVGLFVLSLWVLKGWVAKVSLDELARELEQIRARDILLSILFTALSFVALAGYELYAVRYVRRVLPLRLIALYSFITQSVAHAVGFAVVVGATIRYKLYAPRGFNIIEVAKIQVFFMTTFTLGAMTLIGGVFLLEPGALVEATTVPATVWRLLGALLLATVAAFVGVGTWLKRPIGILGQVVALPGPRVTMIQIALGIGDLLAVAAALYMLMPPELAISYLRLLGIFAAAVTLGLISHVPGSLGVFESCVILLIQPSEELAVPLIGALIAFRAIYYMLPLGIGAIAFGAVELRRWFRSRHDGPDAGALADGS